MTIQEVYPPHVEREIYDKALEQCVISGNRLYNHSELDVWFNIDGFEIKIPTKTHILCTGWDQVRNSIKNMEQEEFYGCTSPVVRNGFKFISGHKLYIYNDLVVFSPDSARANRGYYGTSERTLEEHIALINTMNLETATVVGEDLNFLPRCPSLKRLSIEHAKELNTSLDFSPLYEMPAVESLNIAAPNMGQSKAPAILIDFTKIRSLRHLSVCTNDRFNYPLIPQLETLSVSNDKYHTDMTTLSCSQELKRIDLLQCGIKTLNGVEKYPLQWLSLDNLRSLADISALSGCKKTLRALCIDTCSKIKDFSCLDELKNLEFLQLHGSNILPDLSFLRKMPKLKVINFTMTIEDGNLTPCLDVPYATFSRGKRHYNLKDSDLPKEQNNSAFELL